MRLLTVLALAICVSFVGCKPAKEDVLPKTKVPTPSGNQNPATSGTTGSAPAPQSNNSQNKIRFVADKRLEVPGMMCPFGCYPTVEKTLATVPGVKGVQLAEQPNGTPEGEIALKVVELQLAEGFDMSVALAALKSAEFESKEIQ